MSTEQLKSSLVEDLLRRMEQNHGTLVPVTVGDRTWWVPRRYIALHGLRACDVQRMAAMNGWEEAEKPKL